MLKPAPQSLRELPRGPPGTLPPPPGGFGALAPRAPAADAVAPARPRVLLASRFVWRLAAGLMADAAAGKTQPYAVIAGGASLAAVQTAITEANPSMRRQLDAYGQRRDSRSQ